MKKIINRLTLILIMVVAVGLFGGTAEAEASVTVVVNANGSVTELPETDCSSDDYDRDEWGNHPTADPDATPTWTLPSDNVSSSDLTNDHHVALKDAHVSGGCDWSAAMKNDFSSDSDNLNPTTRSFNSSKGSRTPDQLTGIAERIINTDDEKCDYATQHDAVKDEYDLSMTDSERSTVTLWLSFCQEGDGGSSPQLPSDRVFSSSDSANARVRLQLTIGSLPAAMAVGSSVELYLEEDFQVPDFIGPADMYFVVTNPMTRQTGYGTRVHTTTAAVIRNGSYFGGDHDWSIQVFVPDLCTNLTDECEGSNGPMRGQTLTLVIDEGAGIKNPSEAGSYSAGYSLLGPVDNGNRGPEVRLDNLETYAKISLSDLDNRRGYELTVSGAGFNNGTTAGVYVLHDPSVGSDVFDNGASEAALCERIINQGTLVGSALVGSDDRVSVTFVVTVPIFRPGNTNYICMIDGEGRMSHTDVDRFHLEHSVRVGPSTVRIGDTTTVFAQDFPNFGAGFAELKLAGRTIATPGSATAVSVDGSATATFTVPDGLVGTVGVEATWGNVSASTRMTVVSATQTLPLTRPVNVQVASNTAGELTLTWEGGDNADAYLLMAMLLDTFEYEFVTVSGDARTGTVTGLTSGRSYVGVVVALQTTAGGVSYLYDWGGPVTVATAPGAARALPLNDQALRAVGSGILARRAPAC